MISAVQVGIATLWAESCTSTRGCCARSIGRPAAGGQEAAASRLVSRLTTPACAAARSATTHATELSSRVASTREPCMVNRSANNCTSASSVLRVQVRRPSARQMEPPEEGAARELLITGAPHRRGDEPTGPAPGGGDQPARLAGARSNDPTGLHRRPANLDRPAPAPVV